MTSHLFTWPLQPCPLLPFYLISYQENLVLKPMFAGIQDITLQRNNGEDPGSAPAVIFRIRPFVQPLNTVPSLCTVCFTVHGAGGRVGTQPELTGARDPRGRDRLQEAHQPHPRPTTNRQEAKQQLLRQLSPNTQDWMFNCPFSSFSPSLPTQDPQDRAFTAATGGSSPPIHRVLPGGQPPPQPPGPHSLQPRPRTSWGVCTWSFSSSLSAWEPLQRQTMALTPLLQTGGQWVLPVPAPAGLHSVPRGARSTAPA